MNDKTVVTVAGMARMVGLSRQRFHQLIQAGVFPAPVYDVATRRPFYPPDLQEVCLVVRKNNQGVNGKVIMFYSPRRELTAPKRKPKAKQPKVDTELLDGLRSLGLAQVTPKQIESAMKTLFPRGTTGVDQGEVLKTVFLHIKRQEQG